LWQTASANDAGRQGSAEAWQEYEEDGRTTQCRLRNQIHAGPWPTIRANKTTDEKEDTWRERNERGDVSTPPLSLAVKMWPTARTEGFDAGARRGNPDSLHSAVKMFPSPHANCAKGAGTHGDGGPNLQTAVKMYPTPNSTDYKGVSQPAGRRPECDDDLPSRVARMYPTIRASEYKGTGPMGSKSQEYRLEKGYLDTTIQEQEQTTGSLNPAWVSLLMTFPPLSPDGRMLRPSEWLNTILSRQDSPERFPIEQNG